MIEKIISRNVGVDSVKPGQIQTVNVDRVMIHDIFIRSGEIRRNGIYKVMGPRQSRIDL